MCCNIKWQCKRRKTGAQGSLHTGQLYTAAQDLPVIHHLAAKDLIKDWESEQKEKKSIVDLSIESCVISSYTAFIAIDEESSEPVSGAMKTYDIRARWHGSNLSSLYSGSDSLSCYDCSDSEDDEDEEMEGGAAEPVGFSGEKRKGLCPKHKIYVVQGMMQMQMKNP